MTGEGRGHGEKARAIKRLARRGRIPAPSVSVPDGGFAPGAAPQFRHLAGGRPRGPGRRTASAMAALVRPSQPGPQATPAGRGSCAARGAPAAACAPHCRRSDRETWRSARTDRAGAQAPGAHHKAGQGRWRIVSPNGLTGLNPSPEVATGSPLCPRIVMGSTCFRAPAILILVFLSVAGLCHLFGGTMCGVRAGQRSRRYRWRLREGESEQQVVP